MHSEKLEQLREADGEVIQVQIFANLSESALTVDAAADAAFAAPASHCNIP